MADEDLPPSYVKKCQIFLRKIQEFKKSTSSQAGGPSHKEPGFKQLRLTSDKLVGYYKRNK
jgi:hypothetical protein